MIKLINQREAKAYWDSIEDPVVQAIIQAAHARIFSGDLQCKGEFDLLFFYQVLEGVLHDRERLARVLTGEAQEHPWVRD